MATELFLGRLLYEEETDEARGEVVVKLTVRRRWLVPSLWFVAMAMVAYLFVDALPIMDDSPVDFLTPPIVAAVLAFACFATIAYSLRRSSAMTRRHPCLQRSARIVRTLPGAGAAYREGATPSLTFEVDGRAVDAGDFLGVVISKRSRGHGLKEYRAHLAFRERTVQLGYFGSRAEPPGPEDATVLANRLAALTGGRIYDGISFPLDLGGRLVPASILWFASFVTGLLTQWSGSDANGEWNGTGMQYTTHLAIFTLVNALTVTYGARLLASARDAAGDRLTHDVADVAFQSKTIESASDGPA